MRKPQSSEVYKDQPHHYEIKKRGWGEAKAYSGGNLRVIFRPYNNEEAEELGLVELRIGKDRSVVRVDELLFLLRNV
jgi:hypothetical protein